MSESAVEQRPDSTKPLLLIDVDGVLNPLGKIKPDAGFEEHRLAGFPVRLNKAHGPALLAFADRFELVWATTWEHQANELIGPRIGLPELPVIEFDFAASKGSKLPDVERYAADRALVWLEDDYSMYEAWALRRNLHIPTCIVKVNVLAGLIERDLAFVKRFAAKLADERYGQAQVGADKNVSADIGNSARD